MDNPARLTDLEARGYVGDAGLGHTWLDVAWRALRREVPSLVERITAGEVDTADVVDVVAAAALRVLRNPEGNESESGQIDDYSESWKRADATQDVYFTAAELRRLQSVATLTTWAGSLRYC